MTSPTQKNAVLAELPFLPNAEKLFDALPDLVFFVKDEEARYVTVNQTLTTRCGRKLKEELIGETAREVFPAPFGVSYYEQDCSVLNGETAVKDQLELHLYLQGGPGWCVTTKLPLHDAAGRIIGLVGVSNDLNAPAAQESGYRELAKGVAYIQQNLDAPLRVDALAELCGLSAYQFEQRMKRVFHLTAGQFISKTRIDAARRMLTQRTTPIVEVALACGFSDQSAFTRQFRLTTGLTPGEYRRT